MARSRKQRKSHKAKLGDQEYRFTASGKSYPVRTPKHEIDPRLEDLRSQLAPLKAALRRFATVPIKTGELGRDGKPVNFTPSGDSVWLYIGSRDGSDGDTPVLNVGDFQAAREALGL